MNVKELFEQIVKKQSQTSEKYVLRRIYLKMQTEQALKLLIKNYIDLITQQSFNKPRLTTDIEKALNFLAQYATGTCDPKMCNKNLLFIGSVGTGKTTLINAFIQLIEQNSNIVIRKYNATEFYHQFVDNPNILIDNYKRPLFIDDIGKEPARTKIYGSEMTFLEFLLSKRYELRSWTFLTSNLEIQELKAYYGDYMMDRVLQTFNIFKFRGQSFRTNNNLYLIN